MLRRRIAPNAPVTRNSTIATIASHSSDVGVDLDVLRRPRPVRCCLDWSEQRHHLPGPLGAAMAVFGVGWKLTYDIGYRLGPLAYGAAVRATGHPAAFALTAVAMLVALRPA